MNLEKFKVFQKEKTVEVITTKKIWGYTRVSSKEQFLNKSLDDQYKNIYTIEQKKEFKIVRMLGGTYESASGDFTRREFTKLINEIKIAKEKPYAIAIRSINRFSRSGGNAISILNELVEKLGVHLIESSTGLCTDNEYDKLEVKKNCLMQRKKI